MGTLIDGCECFGVLFIFFGKRVLWSSFFLVNSALEFLRMEKESFLICVYIYIYMHWFLYHIFAGYRCQVVNRAVHVWCRTMMMHNSIPYV